EIFSSADFIFIFNQSLELLKVEIAQKIFYLDHQDSLKIDNEKLLKNIVLDQQILKKICLIELIKI
ncbi:MAG: HutD family protein, partial [Acinetobacter sp.]|nr:HutD family protein [Acinetobacter sp.]